MTAVKLNDVLTIPDLVKTTFKCRFGSLVVDADELSLAESGIIKCLPPTSLTAGPVQVSVSFNDGNQWIDSDIAYEYFCDDDEQYVDPGGSRACIDCPKGGLCDGSRFFEPKVDFWRGEGRPLNSKVYEVSGSCQGALHYTELWCGVAVPLQEWRECLLLWWLQCLLWHRLLWCGVCCM